MTTKRTRIYRKTVLRWAGPLILAGLALVVWGGATETFARTFFGLIVILGAITALVFGAVILRVLSWLKII